MDMWGKIASLTVAAAVLTLAGCTNVAQFGYSEAETPMVGFGGPEAASVAVLPFLDKRPQNAGDCEARLLGLVPLAPYGYVEKLYPERSEDFISLGRFYFNPEEDLAAAAVLSLKASKLFEHVTLARSAAKTDAEYLWRGTLTDSTYTGALLTYGVTYFAAPVLWVVGMPEGASHNTLGVRFELLEKKSGRTVWSYEFKGTDCVVLWLYARIGKDTSLYAELMRRAMNQALTDLAAKLPNLPR